MASAEGQAKATIRGSDTDAKELYVYHAAGVGGRSGDKRVIVRDVHGNGHIAGYGKLYSQDPLSSSLPSHHVHESPCHSH